MDTPTTSSSHGSSWSDEEVKALIAILEEGKVQEELGGAVQSKAVCISIAWKM